MNFCISEHLLAPICVVHVAAHHLLHMSYLVRVLGSVIPNAHQVLTIKLMVCNVSIC
jgi:hypothetical protein